MKPIGLMFRKASNALAILLSIGIAVCPKLLSAAPCEATSHGSWYPNSPTLDSSGGMRTALSQCAGQMMHISGGTYYFLPTTLQPGFTVQANTTIYGDTDSHGNLTTVLVVGTQANKTGNFDSLFTIQDVSGVTIKYLDLEGSQDSTGCTTLRSPGYGNAIEVKSTQSQSIETITIQHNRLHNFNGQFWLYLSSTGTSGGIGLHSLIDIDTNVFDASSPLDNCAGSGGINWNVYGIWMQGDGTSAGAGIIENVAVASNTFYANYIKGAVAVLGGNLKRISIQNNQIYNAGRGIVENPPSNKELGRYAILLYSHPLSGPLGTAASPDTIWVAQNQISSPVSCGIYAASVSNVQIWQNSIFGQTDPYDGTIPKGAIALNGIVNPNPLPNGSLFQVNNNNLDTNLYGIEVVGGFGTFNSNWVVNVPASGIGIKVDLSNQHMTGSLAFSNTTISTTNYQVGAPISMLGRGLASGCSSVLPSGVLLISGLTQIGWTSSTADASLEWVDVTGSNCHYDGFGPNGASPWLEPTTNLISNVTRQLTPTDTPVAQTVFWPYTN